MKDLSTKIRELFPDTLNCAQTIFKIVAEKKGIELPISDYLFAGLGGGIGMQGDMCGAFTGGVAVIGILVSRDIKDLKEHKKTTYRLAGEFLTKMKEEFSTTTCSELIGYDITNSELRKEKNHLFKELCPKFVEKAVQIILEMFPH